MDNQSPEIQLIVDNSNSASAAVGTEENDDNSTSIANTTSSLNRQNSSTVESNNDNKKDRLRLYRAAIKGDWESAAEVIGKWPDLVREGITDGNETVLHVAALARKVGFVEKLLAEMNSRDLESVNLVGSTALSFAALDESLSIAKAMLSKNDKLATVCGPQGHKPLYVAALSAEKEMVNHLYPLSELQSWSDEHLAKLFTTCITIGLLDVALRLLEDYPKLTLAKDKNGETALHVLARMASEFAVATQQRKWRRFIYSVPGMKKARDENGMQNQAHDLLKRLLGNLLDRKDLEISDMIEETTAPLFIAAQVGNTQFLGELIETFPDLRWRKNQEGHTIFHIAVLERHAKIFNLLHNTGSFKKLITSYRDRKQNNILHLAARLAPQTNISGAFLQMQLDMLWFKEVEKTVQPVYREMLNSDSKTPREVFTENHRDLMREGEKWIKGTAKSSTIVATLIATLAFTALFTISGVGGGKNESLDTTVTKTYRKNNKFFGILSISEGVSLLFSSTSILIFLSILTSRYAENDFLTKLPQKLLYGMTTLFISLAAMMVAMGTTMLLFYQHGFVWINVIFVLLSAVPTMYILLIYSLLVDIYCSINLL